MTAPASRPRRTGRRLAAAIAVLGLLAAPARAQDEEVGPDVPSRQVTLFGIVATKGGKKVDEKLKPIEAQLKQLLPGYGFKLVDVQSRRLAVGGKLTNDYQNGFAAETVLRSVLDANGKVTLQFTLTAGGQPYTTSVSTPPNQLFFVDKPLTQTTRLIIGIGAR